jgi:hypothetical protein
MNFTIWQDKNEMKILSGGCGYLDQTFLWVKDDFHMDYEQLL